MKRILSLVLAVMMLVGVLALTACGGTETEADLTVGAIYIGSQSETAGYTYAHDNGIDQAIAALKAQGYTVKLLIQDNVAEEDAAVTEAIDALAGQGCDIIFGISFGYLNAMNEAAAKPEYKDIIFSHATGYLSNDTNFNNYFGRIYQARYLAGIAAGLKAKEDGRKADDGKYHLGYVAAYGTEYAETCSGINGFTLGVQAVLGDEAAVYVKTINTWGNPELEKQAAEALVNTYKCTVIAQHCDSAQPQIVADDAGVFGCGYNSDMTGEAPDGHLIAPIWHWNVYYQLAMETALKTPDQFMEKVGIYYGGLKEGFVDVSPVSKNCTADTQAKIDAVRALIVSGEWDVFSNVKLSFDADGKIVKTTSALTTNTGKVVISEDNATYSVLGTDGEAKSEGGASAVDGIIKGSMNYFVEGIEVVN